MATALMGQTQGFTVEIRDERMLRVKALSALLRFDSGRIEILKIVDGEIAVRVPPDAKSATLMVDGSEGAGISMECEFNRPECHKIVFLNQGWWSGDEKQQREFVLPRTWILGKAQYVSVRHEASLRIFTFDWRWTSEGKRILTPLTMPGTYTILAVFPDGHKEVRVLDADSTTKRVVLP
jgi:hypothetical protein